MGSLYVNLRQLKMHKVIVIDRKHAGTREWRKWGAEDAFENLGDEAEQEDQTQYTLFAHVTDFYEKTRDNTLLISQEERQQIRTFCKKRVVAVVVVSGAESISQDAQRQLTSILNPNAQDQLEFYKRILPTDCNSDELQRRFGSFIKSRERGECEFALLYQDEIDELVLAFRILLELYVLARTQERIPESLQAIKDAISKGKLDRAYWGPVLDGKKEKLHPLLCVAASSPDASPVIRMIRKLQSCDSWDDLPDSYWKEYETTWVGEVTKKPEK